MMNNTDFKRLLFRAAFSVMACDGEVHEKELAEMKEIAANAPYFDGLNHEKELQNCVVAIKTKGRRFIEEFFSLLQETEFNEKQVFQLIEVLVRIVEADEKVEDSELHFIHRVRKHLNFSDETVILKFPRHIHLLIDLEQYGEAQIRSDLEELDFGNIDGLFRENGL